MKSWLSATTFKLIRLKRLYYKKISSILNVIQINTRKCVIKFVILLGETIITILILLQVTFIKIRSHSGISLGKQNLVAFPFQL